MRIFYVFAAICIVGVYSSLDDYLHVAYDYWMESCAKDLNIDFAKMKEFIKANSKPNDDAYRLYICTIQRMNKKPVSDSMDHDGLKEFLEEENEPKGAPNAVQIRQDVLKNLTDCKSKGVDELEFLKCIKFMETPYLLKYKQYVDLVQALQKLG